MNFNGLDFLYHWIFRRKIWYTWFNQLNESEDIKMDILEIMKERHSVRQYKNQAIEPSKREEISTWLLFIFVPIVFKEFGGVGVFPFNEEIAIGGADDVVILLVVTLLLLHSIGDALHFENVIPKGVGNLDVAFDGCGFFEFRFLGDADELLVLYHLPLNKAA